jgi:hypothetical protein
MNVDIGFDAGEEAFSAMMALKLLVRDGPSARPTLVHRLAATVTGSRRGGRFRMFPSWTDFAADTDCTSVAAASLYEAGRLSKGAFLRCAEQLLLSAADVDLPAEANVEPGDGATNGPLHRGVVMVYWEDDREPGARRRGRKHDPAVALNALYALKLAAHEGLRDPQGVIGQTMDFAAAHLLSGRYRQGTRYYPSPDTFLYFASCLCRRFPEVNRRLREPLTGALIERSRAARQPGGPADPQSALNLAQRTLTAANLDVDLGTIRQQLALTQEQAEDGSWPAAPLFSMGKRKIFFGSKPLTTVFALAALGDHRRDAEQERFSHGDAALAR